MNVSGFVLAALTIAIGTPVVSDARPDRAVGASLPGLPSAVTVPSPEGSPEAVPHPAPFDLVIEVRDLARERSGVSRIATGVGPRRDFARA